MPFLGEGLGDIDYVFVIYFLFLVGGLGWGIEQQR